MLARGTPPVRGKPPEPHGPEPPLAQGHAPSWRGLARSVAARPIGRVCANFVGADAFLLVADLIWMHSHIQMRNLLVSASYASHAACDQPIWQVARIQT